MKRFSVLGASALVLLVFVWTVNAEAGDENKKKKKKTAKGSAVAGKVVKTDATSITIAKKGKKGAPSVEKKVTVNKDTKYEKAGGRKKKDAAAKAATPAALSDVTVGSHVRATVDSNNVASRVVILPQKKKKAKAG